jgi:hypothetical protein
MFTNAAYWDRTKWLWDMIAQHYRGNNTIAAYDLLNEPWDASAEDLATFSYELFNVVRAKDPDHVILLPGHHSGIDAYKNPNHRGLANNSLWMHFYPGFWGWNETAPFGAGQANMHSDWLHCTTPNNETCEWKNKIDELKSPFLIGEFQPWAKLGAYGGQITRMTYDTYNYQYGWAATNWAYKTTTNEGSNGNTDSWAWGMVTNRNDGGAYGDINVSNASAAQIETWFRAFGTQALVRNESIAYWMNWRPEVGYQVEAEMFKTHSGVNTEVTSDGGVGFNVGYIDANDWMTYSIDIPAGGAYRLDVRVASPSETGQLVFSKNASDIATLTVPNTGGWQNNWTTISTTVNLVAGQQDLAFFARTGGYNINWWKLTKL